ncbi:MAG TPA: hypothetical protein PKE55_08270 [Kiritimatiellia bacterium]|nr:hypothetical protein [Kiritimatiellia bacterium]
MLNILRKSVFHVMDLLRGQPVGRHLRELEAFVGMPREKQDQHISSALSALLSHAVETTPRYQSHQDAKHLSAFPVINKRELVSGPETFRSRSFPAAGLVERTTSGSYGTPMSVFFSRNKFNRQVAELIHFNRKAGLEVGDRYINITTNRKGPLERWLKNIAVLNPAVMNPEWYPQAIDLLRQNPRVVIVGFPSVLLPLAHYLEEHELCGSLPLKSMVTIAEPLHEHVRLVIARAFQCPVYNRYATMETGVLAHTADASGNLEINRASYIVELLSAHTNQPVREGEEGRIVVTDLYSHAMPLIRYETGDTAVLRSADSFGARIISHVEGRQVEFIYSTDGSRLSWAVIYDIMSYAEHLIQYQFSQESDTRYQLSIVPGKDYSQHDQETLQRKFKALLGEDADIEFKILETITPLPSGKRPMIINRNPAHRMPPPRS